MTEREFSIEDMDPPVEDTEWLAVVRLRNELNEWLLERLQREVTAAAIARSEPARNIVVAENKRLREALQQYANKKLWSEDGQFMDCKNDEGAEIARIALLKQED